MDRNVDEMITGALTLDRVSQRQLADAIENNLSGHPLEGSHRTTVMKEAKRRLDEYRRGEGTSLTREESMGRVRNMIEEAKRSRA